MKPQQAFLNLTPLLDAASESARVFLLSSESGCSQCWRFSVSSSPTGSPRPVYLRFSSVFGGRFTRPSWLLSAWLRQLLGRAFPVRLRLRLPLPSLSCTRLLHLHV